VSEAPSSRARHVQPPAAQPPAVQAPLSQAPLSQAEPVRALAVTVSNRAAAGVYEDRSGPVLAGLLRSAGCEVVDGPVVVPDGEPVEAALRDAAGAGYDLVVTTGGTGLTPADLTPEMTRRVLDREIPGIAEAIRSAGAAAGVPAAILSRGLAGLAGRTLIVNLPGSTGGVKDGMAVLLPVLGHAIDQIRGGDHPRPPAT
jgi:molybdenum cofactor synthesis domain-containing protein